MRSQKSADVPNRLLDEDVFVANEDDPDDLRALGRYLSSHVQSSKGRTAPRHCPRKIPRAESPSAGS